MWCERMRQDWQHTSLLAATFSGSKKVKPQDINPMENGGRSGHSSSFKLDSDKGFEALASVARQWPGS